MLFVTIHDLSLVRPSYSPVITSYDLVNTMLTPTNCPEASNFELGTVELAGPETAGGIRIGVCNVIG